ncbi:FAD/NAD(P)-binding domain-containing protein [Mycena albidolilacea]|uniref:FAD/NAD(P)-binding domain-containing protein n=1 Tax=Mycena albidolilacea TaxID=1033008 RepID=A0AAD6ZLS1_9AGAR|nr:FAD/NAD(P)-binding domain-containing protein [Mycena albidolilacea]
MIDPLPSSTEVCIVGAGPSGLACALGLAARQIPFVIVDALEAGHNSSRAVLMQASALEALGTLHPQLPEELVSGGIQSKTLTTIDLQERVVFCLRMTDIAAYTKYAFSLLIPQHKVEHRMREYVQGGGNSIHWHKRVTDVKEVAQGSQYELRFESGEILTARYVVAADGSKSFLRSFVGIRFIDPYTKKETGPGKNDLSFVVADVQFASPLPTNVPRDGLQMMIGAGGVVLTAPLLELDSAGSPRNNNLFRLYLGVPDTPPRSPDAAYLQAILDARGPGSHSKLHTVPQIAKVLDSSRYRTRPALVDRYVQRAKGGAYILLVGDSAHKHGPAGGQGMNMGICDGIELAQAIDEHRKSSLDAEKSGTTHDAVQIMDVYSTHRRSVAGQVIDMVESMTQVEKGGRGWGPYFRTTALWFVFKVPFVNGVLAWKISGLGHAKKI